MRTTEQDLQVINGPIGVSYMHLAARISGLTYKLVNGGEASSADEIYQLVDNFEATHHVPRLTPEIAMFIPDDEYSSEIYVSGMLDGVRQVTDALSQDIEPDFENQELPTALAAKMARALTLLEFSDMPYIAMDMESVAAKGETVCGKRYLDGFEYALDRVSEYHRVVLNSKIGSVYRQKERSSDDRKFVVLGYAALKWLGNTEVARRHYDRPMFATLQLLLNEGEYIEQTDRRLHITPAGAAFVKEIAADLP